MMYNNAVLIGL